MDLPFVGLVTFAQQPACTDWDKLDGADVAILGVPIDTASSYRVGTRFGPRAIRELSMFHGFGPEGVFDFEDEVTYLSAKEVKIVDAGDSDVIYGDTRRSLANAEQAVRALLDAKTMPFIFGGITRSAWRRSQRTQMRSRSTSCISTRILIFLQAVTASPGAMAARCVVLPKWRM